MKSSNQYTAQINSDGSIVDVLAIEGYAPAHMDNSSPAYYGFVRADGYWYIQKAETVGNVTTYTFATGSSDYETNWTGRAGLTYGRYDTKF